LHHLIFLRRGFHAIAKHQVNDPICSFTDGY